MSIEVAASIDDQLWDEFVGEASGANIFHTRQFFDAFSNSNKYRPFTFFLVEGGKPKACLLALQARILGPRFGDLVSRSVVYGGALLADDLDHNYIKRHVPKLVRAHDVTLRRRAIYSEIRNVGDPLPVLLSLTGEKHRFIAHINYLVNLTAGEETVWNQIVPKRRRLIKRAAERDVEVTEASGKDDLDSFTELVTATYSRVKMPCFESEIFERAWDVLAPLGRLRIILARHEGRVIGTMAALVYNGLVFDWYAASSEKGDELDVNSVLAWNMMQWGCRQGHRVFDFGGAGDPHVDYGVREFKARFRGELVNYGRFTKIYAPVRYALAVAGYQSLRGIIFR